jgi:hypothetical protein
MQSGHKLEPGFQFNRSVCPIEPVDLNQGKMAFIFAGDIHSEESR